MSLLSTNGLVAAYRSKTAFSISDIADAVASTPSYLREGYYGIKDLTYPIRSSLRISDYGDRFDDRLSQLGALGDRYSIGLKRDLDREIFSPLMDATRF